jgi:hypothetical protein
MTKRSTKLKIFLMADLVLLCFVVPGYFYAESQIPASATFQVADLILDSYWLQFGEPLQISVNVTNIGDKSGSHLLTLTIDEVEIATKSVEVSGGETATATFTATELTEGDHTVAIGSLTESFKVTSETPTKQAELRLTNLVTNRKEAEVGDPVTASVTATNVGDEAGEFSLELFVNNQKRETKTIQLDGGDTTSVQFEIVENIEGEYAVKLGTLTTSFRITSQAQTVKPAEFQVTELKVNPSLVLADEVVEVSVKVTNVGEETGTYTVNLKIGGVTRDTEEVTLAGQAVEVVEFEVSETSAGTYTVGIGAQSGSFTVESLPPASPDTRMTRMYVTPYEVWGGETVTIGAKVTNLADEPSTLQVRLLVDEEVEETKAFPLDAGATDVSVEFTVTAGSGPTDGKPEGYRVKLVNLGNQTNTLSGYFQIAPDGFHTLSINRAGGGSIPLTFTLDGVTYDTPYMELKPVGEYTLSAPRIVELKYGVVEFSHWQDDVTTESRTFTLDRHLSIIAHYIVISGYASCPSLYYWNGSGYVYVTEVSNAGWLGYIDYIDENGDIIFGGGNPWDHVKLDNSQIQTKIDENGEEYYDVILFQQWDEMFYLDTAYLVAVDHPSDVDVYSTMVNYINPGFFGEIYTVDGDNLLTPISATDGNGEDVLSLIAERDNVFTPATNGVESPSWDNITFNQLTLDLGDLSDADEIKLVITGMVDWGPAEPYYEWIDQFKTAFAEGVVPAGTQLNPPPYMEVMDAQGNWVRVPQDRQMPTPADYVPRTFAVDLNGLFPEDTTEYKIRITNFWNVTFDYVGIDVSPQQDITVTEILPTATLEALQFADSTTTASGMFTKYGDVTELLLEADDMYVIGVQGDTVSLNFSTSDLPPLEADMERSFFVFVASWFKDPPGNWGYGFDFTVEPLPFRSMSGFPYPDTESYPTSEEYIQYLKEWNTRAVNVPEKITVGGFVAELLKLIMITGLAIAGILVTLIWKKS